MISCSYLFYLKKLYMTQQTFGGNIPFCSFNQFNLQNTSGMIYSFWKDHFLQASAYIPLRRALPDHPIWGSTQVSLSFHGFIFILIPYNYMVTYPSICCYPSRSIKCQAWEEMDFVSPTTALSVPKTGMGTQYPGTNYWMKRFFHIRESIKCLQGRFRTQDHWGQVSYGK